ncbi:MAG TPA: M23 family metallopeptidase, partial [Anaerolineae bacterium]|nr:M23 family metallopeptidase [Anaerolineae bacterium]
MNLRHLFKSDHIIFSLLFSPSFIMLLWFCFFLVFLEFHCKSELSAEELPWPIDAPNRISSSFGEPRQGRFHFGMDFKSGGTTGKKVFAVGDGYIFRVNTSPFGYGKGLYLKLDTGEIIVFGHLSGYLPDIEDRLFTMRINKKSYDIDWWPQPNEFRVKKGEVIAYSGDTGSGPAHLHMELRDENDVPMNPLNHGINVHDTIPPTIDSIVFIPLDNISSVDGFQQARWIDFSSDYTTPVVLQGAVGVAVSCYDTVNLSDNHLGAYYLALSVDSTVVFSKKYDRLPYSVGNYGSLDYLSGENYGGYGYLATLFRKTGNHIDFYEGDGVLSAGRFGQCKCQL